MNIVVNYIALVIKKPNEHPHAAGSEIRVAKLGKVIDTYNSDDAYM